MTALQPTTNDRIKSAIATIAIQALLGYALVAGLAMTMPRNADDSLKLFRVALPSPPPPDRSIPPPQRSQRPDGAASPPNLRSKATEIVAPVPIVQVLQPPPVVVAEKPGIGADPTTGAADIRGPGTGSGGVGNGTGGGGYGNGDGGGGDETPPRWRRGDLSNADFPASVLSQDFHGTVSVQYVVTTQGRATQCSVTRSSGSVDVDNTTCRLIEKRFRFDPSRDAAGHPVPVMIVENHTWDLEHDRPAPRS